MQVLAATLSLPAFPTERGCISQIMKKKTFLQIASASYLVTRTKEVTSAAPVSAELGNYRRLLSELSS